VRACVDAWLKEKIDARIDVLPREVVNDPLRIAVCCSGGTDSLHVQGGT
jgi:predicted PP-loop superfamily ATPase